MIMLRSSARCVALAIVAGALAWSVQPARASAYGEPQSFAESVMLGGGGAKYFTGSHAEGYTCQVCHTGGHGPVLQIKGLPVDGYVPSQTYPITIDWADELPAVGLNLEMTDDAGNRFGELSAIDPAYLSPADLCSGGEATGASETVDLPNGRRILTVARCGQHQTTFLWKAPAQLAQGWISGSAVAANRKKDILGDGVTNISRVFGAQGAPTPVAGDLVANCSSAGRARSSSAPILLLLMGFVVSRTRKRSRRARSHRNR
jgi:hypothetical protein